MTPRIITADEAKAFTAKWRGYDGPYGVSWDDEGDCVVHYDDMTVARVAHFDGGHTEPLARLFAAAPDDVKSLAHTVIARAAEIASLRAIIDGRTTPPTDEEIAAHCGAGGRWRSIVPGDFILSTGDGDAEDARQTSAVQHANAAIVTRAGVRWWAIDAQGRCSAWPVVAEASR